MSAPDPAEAVFLGEGEARVSLLVHKPNHARVRVAKEDHTLGALWQAYLLKRLSSGVQTAAYCMPHPLTPAIEVECTSTKDGALGELQDALAHISADLGALRRQTT